MNYIFNKERTENFFIFNFLLRIQSTSWSKDKLTQNKIHIHVWPILSMTVDFYLKKYADGHICVKFSHSWSTKLILMTNIAEEWKNMSTYC